MGVVSLAWKDSLGLLLNCMLPLVWQKSFKDDRFKEY